MVDIIDAFHNLQIEVSGEATCGEIGLKLVEETKQQVVIIDLLLPDMSGLVPA